MGEVGEVGVMSGEWEVGEVGDVGGGGREVEAIYAYLTRPAVAGMISS